MSKFFKLILIFRRDKDSLKALSVAVIVSADSLRNTLHIQNHLIEAHQTYHNNQSKRIKKQFTLQKRQLKQSIIEKQSNKAKTKSGLK